MDSNPCVFAICLFMHKAITCSVSSSIFNYFKKSTPPIKLHVFNPILCPNKVTYSLIYNANSLLGVKIIEKIPYVVIGTPGRVLDLLEKN